MQMLVLGLKFKSLLTQRRIDLLKYVRNVVKDIEAVKSILKCMAT